MKEYRRKLLEWPLSGDPDLWSDARISRQVRELESWLHRCIPTLQTSEMIELDNAVVGNRAGIAIALYVQAPHQLPLFEIPLFGKAGDKKLRARFAQELNQIAADVDRAQQKFDDLAQRIRRGGGWLVEDMHEVCRWLLEIIREHGGKSVVFLLPDGPHTLSIPQLQKHYCDPKPIEISVTVTALGLGRATAVAQPVADGSSSGAGTDEILPGTLTIQPEDGPFDRPERERLSRSFMDREVMLLRVCLLRCMFTRKAVGAVLLRAGNAASG